MSAIRHSKGAGSLFGAAGGPTANQAICFLSGAVLALLLQSALKPAANDAPSQICQNALGAWGACTKVVT